MSLFDTAFIPLICIQSLQISVVVYIAVWLVFSLWRYTANVSDLTKQGVVIGSGLSSNPNSLDVPLPCQITEHNLRTHIVPVRWAHDFRSAKDVTRIAETAHILGHVQLHRENALWTKILYFLIPAIQGGSILCYPIILAGIFIQSVELVWVALVLGGAVAIFSLLTLLIELIASLRGLRLLRERGAILSGKDRIIIPILLSAITLTPIAVFVTGFLQIYEYLATLIIKAKGLE